MVEDIFGKYWYLRVSISSAANACQEHKRFRLLLLGLPAPDSRSLRQKLIQWWNVPKNFIEGIPLPSQYGGLVVIMVTYATSENGLSKYYFPIFHQEEDIINTKDSVNVSLVGVSWIHCLIDIWNSPYSWIFAESYVGIFSGCLLDLQRTFMKY